MKANSNLSVLKVLAGEGLGADTVSEGEIRRALAAGIAPEKIVFSGVGKTDTELAFAIRTGVLEINVESAAELDRLIAVAAGLGARPDIVFRVNPRVGSGAHAKITTGAPATSSVRRWRRSWPSMPVRQPRTMCGPWVWPATSAARSRN